MANRNREDLVLFLRKRICCPVLAQLIMSPLIRLRGKIKSCYLVHHNEEIKERERKRERWPMRTALPSHKDHKPIQKHIKRIYIQQCHACFSQWNMLLTHWHFQYLGYKVWNLILCFNSTFNLWFGSWWKSLFYFHLGQFFKFLLFAVFDVIIL